MFKNTATVVNGHPRCSRPGTGARCTPSDRCARRRRSNWPRHRFDPVFHNRQDVEMVRLSPTGHVQGRIRLTRKSNETESDPILNGQFIGDYIQGDYIQVEAIDGSAYVADNYVEIGRTRRPARYHLDQALSKHPLTGPARTCATTLWGAEVRPRAGGRRT
jgi:hypothetical protein